MPVSPLENNFYARWRLQCGRTFFLGESNSPLPERLLQVIWFHQRLLRDQLRTLDGRAVRVLHPGFWNHEAGPDFHDAVVQIGNEPAKSGDIEIDICSDGWKQHGHDKNPNFANVLLHVVWDEATIDTQPATRNAPATCHTSIDTSPIPTMALQPFLDAPLNELSLWLGSDSARSFPENLKGSCCGPLQTLTDEKLESLLRQAAFVRFQRKANDLQARAKQGGWEQALWEGIFRALGYKQNIWPMQRLGELISRAERGAQPRENSSFPASRSVLEWQAWLLGVGGLLPTQPEETNDDKYLRRVWEFWWRERDAMHESVLPRNLWRFHGIRPSNLPQRRLALAAHWLTNPEFFPNLEKWFTEENSPSAHLTNLISLLQVEEDPFWSWHWTFRSIRLGQPQPLIGASRVSDLAINVILPWFWIRALAGKNEALQRHAEKIYFAWPAGEDNVVLRQARNRLFAGAIGPRQLKTAAEQQGLLQIVRDFCEHSNAVCADCRFPDLVRGLSLDENLA